MTETGRKAERQGRGRKLPVSFRARSAKSGHSDYRHKAGSAFPFHAGRTCVQWLHEGDCQAPSRFAGPEFIE
jgi:hypothetical protein